MAWGRYFTKRNLILLTIGAAFYVGFWFLTCRFGVPHVRSGAIASLPITPSFTEVDRNHPQPVKGPFYYCRTIAYAPFFVRSDYGWQAGALNGGGSSALYIWMFGITFKLHEFGQWAS